MQSRLVKTLIGARLNSRLLTKPNFGLEVSIINSSRKAHRTFVSRSIPCTESWWRGYRHWSWWWDFEILECVQQGQKSEGEQKCPEFVLQHSLSRVYKTIEILISCKTFMNWFQQQKIYLRQPWTRFSRFPMHHTQAIFNWIPFLWLDFSFKHFRKARRIRWLVSTFSVNFFRDKIN